MARSFSPLLSLSRCSFEAASFLPSSRTILFRSQSSNRGSNRAGELYEFDTGASQSRSDPRIQKLEDAFHRIMVRRSAPDWLPFVPGASYWVPPPQSQSNVIDKVVEKLTNPISEEESTSSARVWPSSDYFIKGVKPQSLELEMASSTPSQEDEGLFKICSFLKHESKKI